jgi:hypothetical protein
MKMHWMIPVSILTAAMAAAQTTAGTATTPRTTPFSKKPAATAKTKSTHTKSAAPKTTDNTTTAGSTTTSRKKSKATAATAAAPKAAKPKAVKKAKPAAAPTAPELAATEAAPAPGRKRDPFISPVQARMDNQSICAGGVRCLAVNEIVLRGVVKSQNGMIAVVENAAQKTYFLHENQPIYNGFVERITPDSVVFKEHYLDNLGHDSQREVVKTVNAPVV